MAKKKRGGSIFGAKAACTIGELEKLARFAHTNVIVDVVSVDHPEIGKALLEPRYFMVHEVTGDKVSFLRKEGCGCPACEPSTWEVYDFEKVKTAEKVPIKARTPPPVPALAVDRAPAPPTVPAPDRAPCPMVAPEAPKSEEVDMPLIVPVQTHLTPNVVEPLVSSISSLRTIIETDAWYRYKLQPALETMEHALVLLTSHDNQKPRFPSLPPLPPSMEGSQPIDKPITPISNLQPIGKPTTTSKEHSDSDALPSRPGNSLEGVRSFSDNFFFSNSIKPVHEILNGQEDWPNESRSSPSPVSVHRQRSSPVSNVPPHPCPRRVRVVTRNEVPRPVAPVSPRASAPLTGADVAQIRSDTVPPTSPGSAKLEDSGSESDAATMDDILEDDKRIVNDTVAIEQIRSEKVDIDAGSIISDVDRAKEAEYTNEDGELRMEPESEIVPEVEEVVLNRPLARQDTEPTKTRQGRKRNLAKMHQIKKEKMAQLRREQLALEEEDRQRKEEIRREIRRAIAADETTTQSSTQSTPKEKKKTRRNSSFMMQWKEQTNNDEEDDESDSGESDDDQDETNGKDVPLTNNSSRKKKRRQAKKDTFEIGQPLEFPDEGSTTEWILEKMLFLISIVIICTLVYFFYTSFTNSNETKNELQPAPYSQMDCSDRYDDCIMDIHLPNFVRAESQSTSTSATYIRQSAVFGPHQFFFSMDNLAWMRDKCIGNGGNETECLLNLPQMTYIYKMDDGTECIARFSNVHLLTPLRHLDLILNKSVLMIFPLNCQTEITNITLRQNVLQEEEQKMCINIDSEYMLERTVIFTTISE